MKKKICLIIFIIMMFIVTFILGINGYVIKKTKDRIIDNADNMSGFDCILVLGAGIRGNEPSPMLEDRLNSAIELYEKGVAPKIIMSGDHGTKDYDEVNIMKQYAIDKGVPSEDIFMDHAGFSTYDSVYRAKEIFKVNKIIIVTQKYHLYRALYIAKTHNIEAYGIASNPRSYVGQKMRDLREILARDKDFFKCLFKFKSKYLGETIPVSGNGDVTNDKL